MAGREKEKQRKHGKPKEEQWISNRPTRSPDPTHYEAEVWHCQQRGHTRHGRAGQGSWHFIYLVFITYEAVSDQGPVWVQSEPIFQGSWKAFLNGQICSNFKNMMYWERILQKNHLITCFRRFYLRPNHLAQYIPILGWVGVGKLIKGANVHSGFYVCYTN